MKFGTDISAPLRMNCNQFGDLLTFPLAPSSGEICNLSKTLVYDQYL